MYMPTVMVVEDERIVALNLCRTLSRLGYNASTVVSNGLDALQRIMEAKPDIVLMDIHIDGDMDGIETAARIPAELMLPVIYLTAYSEDATLDRARSTKPYGYLIKPFSERELHATIMMALQRRDSDILIRENEERLRLVLAAAELGSWEIEPDTGRILCKDHIGWLSDTAPRLVAESFRDFLPTVHEADRDQVQSAFDHVTQQGDLCEIEFRRLDAKDTERWFRVVGKTFVNGTERRRRLLGVMRDITAIKQAQREQRESEQNYRDLISTIDGIIWEADISSDTLTYISDSTLRVLGYDSAQWIANPFFWEQHLHPADAERVIAQYHSATRAEQSFESTYRMIANSGATVWLHEVVSTITRKGSGTLMRGVMVDITNLKEAEEESADATLRLAESESRLTAILNTAAIGILTVDADSRIISFNREAEKIFGHSAATILGEPLSRLIPDNLHRRHKEHVASFLADEAQNRNMGDWRTVNGVAADGHVIPLATIISKVTIGNKLTMTAIMRDMTEALRAEAQLRQSLEDRERALAKAEAANLAKSSFLAVMSHELRTPLNAIIGFSEMMGREIMGPIGNEAYRQYINDIHQSGKLLLTHVNGMLDLSRIESGRHDLSICSVALLDVWDRIASSVAADAAAKNVQIHLLNVDGDDTFAGDPQAMSQILLNLISNAIKFTGANGGKIEIGVEDGDGSREPAFFVRDNGRGIPADRLTDVLLPFVQISDTYTRDTGGVGLGLAICKSLTEAMSGHIEIESELGKGTTVRVFLPPFIAP